MPMNENDRATVSSIRKLAAGKIGSIRADSSLSDAGKRQQIASVHHMASQQLQVERDRIASRDTSRKGKLERDLFGITPNALGADVISYRDAVDRASRLENATQANDLLSRARATGDKALERAVFAHAYEMGGPGPIGQPWNELVEAYLEVRPDLVEPLTELVEVSSTASNFDDSMQFNLPVPQEIVGHQKFDGSPKETDADTANFAWQLSSGAPR